MGDRLNNNRIAYQPVRGGDEAANQPEKAKRTAARPAARPDGLPNYLLNREIGAPWPQAGGSLPGRFAAVRKARLGNIAVAMNCDTEVLRRSYDPRISKLRERVARKHPSRCKLMDKYQKSRKLSVAYEGSHLLAYLGLPVKISTQVTAFFHELFCYECDLRFLEAVSGNPISFAELEGKGNGIYGRNQGRPVGTSAGHRRGDLARTPDRPARFRAVAARIRTENPIREEPRRIPHYPFRDGRSEASQSNLRNGSAACSRQRES